MKLYLEIYMCFKESCDHWGTNNSKWNPKLYDYVWVHYTFLETIIVITVCKLCITHREVKQYTSKTILW